MSQQISAYTRKIAALKDEARKVLQGEVRPAQELLKRDRTNEQARAAAGRGFARVNAITKQIRELETQQRRLAAALGVPVPAGQGSAAEKPRPRTDRVPRERTREEDSDLERQNLAAEAQELLEARRKLQEAEARVAETKRQQERLQDEARAALEKKDKETAEARAAAETARREAQDARAASAEAQQERREDLAVRAAFEVAQRRADRAQQNVLRGEQEIQALRQQNRVREAETAEQRNEINKLRASVAQLEARESEDRADLERTQAEAAEARAAAENAESERAQRAASREARQKEQAERQLEDGLAQLQANAKKLREEQAREQQLKQEAEEEEADLQRAVNQQQAQAEEERLVEQERQRDRRGRGRQLPRVRVTDMDEDTTDDDDFKSAKGSDDEAQQQQRQPAPESDDEAQQQERQPAPESDRAGKIFARPDFDQQATYELPLASSGEATRGKSTFEGLARRLGFQTDNAGFADIVVFDPDNDSATEMTLVFVLQRIIAPYLAGIAALREKLTASTNIAKFAVWSLIGNESEGTKGMVDLLTDGARAVAQVHTDSPSDASVRAVQAYAEALNWVLMRFLTGSESAPRQNDIPGVREGAKLRAERNASPFRAEIKRIFGVDSLLGNELVVGGKTLVNLLMQTGDATSKALLLPAYQALFTGQNISQGLLEGKFLRTMASDMFKAPQGQEDAVEVNDLYKNAIEQGTVRALSGFYKALPSVGQLNSVQSSEREFLGFGAFMDFRDKTFLLGYLVAKAFASVPAPANSVLLGTVVFERQGAEIGKLGRNALTARLVLRTFSENKSIFEILGKRPTIGDANLGTQRYLQSAARPALSGSRAQPATRNVEVSQLSFSSLFRARKSIWTTLSDRQGKAALYSRASKFVSAAQTADDLKFALSDTPSGMRYTVFVPDNDAWRQAAALGKIDSNATNDVLRSHVLLGEITTDMFPEAGQPGGTRTFTTFEDPGEAYMTVEKQRQTVVDRVRGRQQKLVANGREVTVLESVRAGNGIIYLIDAIIPPVSPETALQPRRAALPVRLASSESNLSEATRFAEASKAASKEISVRLHKLPSGAPAAVQGKGTNRAVSVGESRVLREFHEAVKKSAKKAVEARDELEAVSAVHKLQRWFDKQPSESAVRKHVDEATWHAGIDTVQTALSEGHFFAGDGEPGEALEALCDSYYD